MRWKAFKKNKRALFGLGVLAVMYALAGFTFINTFADYHWLPDPNDVHTGEKFYLVQKASPLSYATLERLMDYPSLQEAIKKPGRKVPIKNRGEFIKLVTTLRKMGYDDEEPLDIYRKVYYIQHEEIYRVSLISVENQPPSIKHPFGTDDFGRDVLSRLIYASRISLSVGFVAVGIALAIGIFLGAISGYYGGIVDQIIMRIVDIWISIPGLVLLITMVAVFGPGLFKAMVLIGILSWAGTARIVRGQFLSLREQGFVEAARATGARDWKIIFKHLLPNAMAPIIVDATLFLAGAILLEAGLSFLGLGAQPPTASWGNMLTDGQKYLRTAWWIAIYPGLAIFITVLSFNFIGDGLRDALDPRLRGVR